MHGCPAVSRKGQRCRSNQPITENATVNNFATESLALENMAAESISAGSHSGELREGEPRGGEPRAGGHRGGDSHFVGESFAAETIVVRASWSRTSRSAKLDGRGHLGAESAWTRFRDGGFDRGGATRMDIDTVDIVEIYSPMRVAEAVEGFKLTAWT